MSRPHGFLANMIGECVAEAVLFAGSAWLINHFFGSFHLPDRYVSGFTIAAAVGGLAMFVAIGASRHPEAWKVRLFGAVIAGVFAAEVLTLFITRKR